MVVAPGFAIRRAAAEDAAAAAHCLRRSISLLCAADHCNDAPTLERWLANKTAAQVAQWVASPAHVALVADRHGEIDGVALLSRTQGRIALLYVDPDARFAGVSDALLRALEAAARADGMRTLHLVSTATARRFYASRGYVADGEPVAGFGVTRSQPMVKTLG